MERRSPRPAPVIGAAARRAAMAMRCATALVGGYAAAAVLSSLLARLLPGDRAEATAWGMIVSFLIYTAVGLWCFHERRLAVVVGGVWGAALIGATLLWLLAVRP